MEDNRQPSRSITSTCRSGRGHVFVAPPCDTVFCRPILFNTRAIQFDTAQRSTRAASHEIYAQAVLRWRDKAVVYVRYSSFRLRNDLHCVGWGVKLYSLFTRYTSIDIALPLYFLRFFCSITIFVYFTTICEVNKDFHTVPGMQLWHRLTAKGFG